MKALNQSTIEFVIILIVFVLGFFLSTCVYAQELEGGIMSGSSHYKGDLTQGHPLQWQSTGMVNGIFFRYNTPSRMSWKFNIAYAHIAGNDKYNTNESLRLRNLHFKSSLLEYSIQGEYRFLNSTKAAQNENPFAGKKGNFRCYGFAGVGMMFFKPKAQYNGTWYELQPLGTEGQGIVDEKNKTVAALHYSLVQLVLPLGIGVNYSLSDRIKLGFEIGYRKTFTDYLDDVSGNYADASLIEKANGKIAAALSNRTPEISDVPVNLPGQPRGNAATKDSYIFSTFQISVLIKKLED